MFHVVLFRLEADPGKRPVLVFVHGGFLISGVIPMGDLNYIAPRQRKTQLNLPVLVVEQ